MGGRGSSSMSGRNSNGALKSHAQTIVEQIDSDLTKKFMQIINTNDFYHTYTPEEAVQNIIDLGVPSSYFAQNISSGKKAVASAKRTVNSKRTSDRVRERAQIKLKAAQDSLIKAQWNFEAAKILERK